MMPPRELDTFAAVDLGSNSFHMAIARLVAGEVRILDRQREQVQLAEGLDENNILSEGAQVRGLGALERFGERLSHISPEQVRAVGTNTLRQAKNARVFLTRAVLALGHYVEVISGQEEARLIFLGVAQSNPNVAGRRLVVDIGGGSTECVIGDGFEPDRADSLYMGCVSYSLRYFPGGELTESAMARAETAARLELEGIERPFRDLGWTVANGSSGTIAAIEAILAENGWGEHGIDRKGLDRLRDAVVAAGNTGRLALGGLKAERAPVLPGGLAILSAIFDSLQIDHMHASSGALRDGVLYDLLGRSRDEDIRDRTIHRFIELYKVDESQAARVERVALGCYDQVAAAWGIERRNLRRSLGWAARLHEIGLVIKYTGYHRHGAYLVENSYMPGFSKDDQQLLAALVQGHRRKLPPKLFDDIPLISREQGNRLCALLRLAVLLNRPRNPDALPELALSADDDGLSVRIPDGWLAEHALTRTDLETEQTRLKAVGIELTVA